MLYEKYQEAVDQFIAENRDAIIEIGRAHV